MPTDNKSLVRRVAEELWNQSKPENANQIFHTDCVEHDPATPNTGRGVDSFRTMYDTYHAAFRDSRFTIEDIIAEGDHVAVRWTIQGTHRGALRGIRPTNKRVTVTGATFYRVRNGKIQEAWDNWDALGLMRQLGAIHEPAGRTWRIRGKTQTAGEQGRKPVCLRLGLCSPFFGLVASRMVGTPSTEVAYGSFVSSFRSGDERHRSTTPSE